jgi:hypothetical protein
MARSNWAPPARRGCRPSRGPERPYWPKGDTAYTKANSPRGVLHTFAGGKIDDTGPLNRKRMETIDDETTQAAIDFMSKQAKAGTPFFTWMNFTRMHVFTHVREIETFVEYPPSQEPASFTIDQIARDVERKFQEKAGKK